MEKSLVREKKEREKRRSLSLLKGRSTELNRSLSSRRKRGYKGQRFRRRKKHSEGIEENEREKRRAKKEVRFPSLARRAFACLLLESTRPERRITALFSRQGRAGTKATGVARVAKEGEKKRVEETLSFESLLSLFCFLPPVSVRRFSLPKLEVFCSGWDGWSFFWRTLFFVSSNFSTMTNFQFTIPWIACEPAPSVC